jgi:hypothetical protein
VVKIEIRVFVVMVSCSLNVSEGSATSIFRVEAYLSISSSLLIAVVLGSEFLRTAATDGSIVPADDEKSRGVDDRCKGNVQFCKKSLTHRQFFHHKFYTNTRHSLFNPGLCGKKATTNHFGYDTALPLTEC